MRKAYRRLAVKYHPDKTKVRDLFLTYLTPSTCVWRMIITIFMCNPSFLFVVFLFSFPHTQEPGSREKFQLITTAYEVPEASVV